MKFAVMAVILVAMFGVFHVLFITMDYVFNDPTEGTFTRMQDRLNETWNIQTQNSVQNMSVMLKTFFGYGRVAVLVMIPIVFFVMSTRKPKME